MKLPRFAIASLAVLALATAAHAAPRAEKQALLKKIGEHRLLTGRLGAAAVAYGDHIYITGGSAGGATADIERLNIHTGAVERVYDNLIPRRYHAAIEYQGKIYLFGGQGYRLQTLRFEETVEIYDIATKSLTRGAAMPSPRFNMGVVRLGSKVCLVGGVKARNDSEAVHTGEMDIYDLATNQWLSGPAMPTSREAPAALVGNFIIVAGGFRGGRQLAEVEMFVPQENAWKALPPLSRKVSSHSLVKLDPYLFLFGDYADLDSVLAYDLRTRTSIDVAGANFRGVRHSAAIVHNERIYVIGGNTDAEGSERGWIQVFALNQPAS